MKRILFVIAIAGMFMQSLASGPDYDRDTIVMKFNNSISPSYDGNGIVVTGIASIDTLNVQHGCDLYKLADYAWSQNIHNVLYLFFDVQTTPDVSSILSEYEIAGDQYCQYVELVNT